MTVAINIVLIIASLVLIVAVLMQEGNKQGLGAIGGAAETFLGKNKSKSYEGKLLMITKVTAAIFVVLAILLTWLNSQTYTVRYYADGKEYFPSVEGQIFLQEALGGAQLSADEKQAMREQLIAGSTEEALVDHYSYGEAITAMSVPVKEGYNGVWDKELPAKMDRNDYVLNAIYTIGEYTLTYKIDDVTVAEGKFVFGADVTLEEPELPEKEGYTVAWTETPPTVMPGRNVTLSPVYTVIAPEATPSDAAPTEPDATPAEPDAEPDATPAEPDSGDN